MIDSNFEIRAESLLIEGEEAIIPDVFRDSKTNDFRNEESQARHAYAESFEDFKLSDRNENFLPKANSAVILPQSSPG